MKKLRSVVMCVALVAFFANGTSIAQKKKMGEPVIWPAGKIAWTEMKDGPPGVSYASLWGAMDKGAHGMLVKLPAGSKHPLHIHSHEIKAVVISGTFVYQAEGGEEQRLGPGSYFMIPAGLRHSSGTADDGVCELFQQSPGKFDLIPVGTAGEVKK